MRAPITFALTACASLAVWVGSPPAEAVPTTAASGAEAIEEVGTVEVRDERDPAWWWGTDYPQIDRVVALPLAQVMRRNALLLVVDHRTNQEIADNSWHDFLGLDAGALKIGLELRFGVYDNLDLGLLRLNSATERFDVYQLDAKYHLLHQHRHHVDLALRAGLTWFSQQDADDALGGLAQLLIQRRLVDRLTLVTGLLYHSDSTNGVKAQDDTDGSLALMVATDLRLLRWLSWSAEMAVTVAGYGTHDKTDAAGEALTGWPYFATALRFITNRHTFALVVGNSPYMSADGYVANSPRGFDDLIAGFRITREWGF